jgi:hypothetical protein
MDNPSSKEESTEIVIQNNGATRPQQKPLKEDNADNYVNLNELIQDFDKMKKENEALVERLRESEEKAQMAKNEVQNTAIKLII